MTVPSWITPPAESHFSRAGTTSTSSIPIDLLSVMWDGPTVLVKMDQKRRLSVPVNLAATVKPGDSFEATFDPEEGELTFRRINPQADWVELFEQCPVPMDDLPPRSREYPKKLRL